MLLGVVLTGCFACLTISAAAYALVSRTLEPPVRAVESSGVEVVQAEFAPPPTFTVTLEPTTTPAPTQTPTVPPTPYPTTVVPTTALPTRPSEARTDINVCDVEFNDEYLHAYVKWSGLVMHKPLADEDGSAQSFLAQIFPPDTRNSCFRPFFVRYEGSERIYSEDLVEVTGIILTTAYEFEGATGTREHIVMLLADHVKVTPIR